MLGRHILGYLPVQIARAIVGFGAVAVLTRLMPADMYGQYALVVAAMHLTAMGLHTWLDAAVARFHARAEQRNHLASHLMTAYTALVLIGIATIAAGSVLIALLPLSSTLKAALAFALTALVLRSAIQIGLETRRAAGEILQYSLLETFNTLAGFAIGIGLLVATPLGAAGPFAGLAIAGVITLVFDLPAQAKRMKGGKPHKRRARLYLLYGLPISISLVFEHLLSAGDRFLIAGMLSEADVGFYAAGYGLADRTIDIIFIWLGAAAAPLTVRALEEKGMAAAKDIAAQTARIMMMIGLPAAAGIALVAPEMVTIMVGQDFRDGALSVTPWIAAGALMNGLMTYYFHEAFTLKRQTRALAGIMAVCAVFNLGLNVVLLPIYGIVGAALSTLLAYGAGLVACAVIGRRWIALPLPWMDWAKTAFATAGMALALIPLEIGGPVYLVLCAKVSIGAAVYAAINLALNTAGCRSWLSVARSWFNRERAPA